MAFDGTVITGRDEIAAGHRPLFDGIMRGSRLAVVERAIRFTDPATAIVVQRAGIIMRWQRGRTVPSAKRLSTNTTVLRRDGDRWIVAAFQNTRYHPWAKTLMGRLMTRSTP
ncbi:SgcJ/EcaC family oxidoreductase [Micromonospora sp. NPDC005707]|uniref:SgcJ/EcaC family oxidoreductase n=1 Tax=Micromonospora sp. NPDC005707 TaxID=3157050 RepID=UPI0033D52E2B